MDVEAIEDEAKKAAEAAELMSGQTEWCPETGAFKPGLGPEEARELRASCVASAVAASLEQTEKSFRRKQLAVLAATAAASAAVGALAVLAF